MTLLPIEEELFVAHLNSVAYRFNLIDKQISPLTDAKATSLLNLAEEYSLDPADFSQLKSLYICGLLWEMRKDSWKALNPFITRILIRMGLSATAKMTGWDEQFGAFSSFGSLIEELTSAAILKEQEIVMKEQKIVLSNFQKRMWDGLEKYDRLGVSAPTSAGKSFVLVNKAIEILSKKPGKIFYIVPTISLINQVSNDIRKALRQYKIYDIDVAQTVNDISLFRSEKVIYVLTQERAFSALNHVDADFSNVVLLIVDEIQNIEKVTVENEERSKILFDVIQTFKNNVRPEKIVLSGPRLTGLDKIVHEWFGLNSASITADLPPVINITFSFKAIRGRLFFVQYVDQETLQEIEIEDRYNFKDKQLKRQKFDNEEIDFLAGIINRNKNEGTIIFSGTTRGANDIAKETALRIDNAGNSEELNGIKDFLSATIHPQYELINTIGKGVAYHHSKMPSHARNLVEKLFIDKHLSTVVATTTLMQGVNLPAKNIIIKTPSVGGDGENLTGYEFANLKGRAGRLMQDLVGRALVINQKSCEKVGIDLGNLDQKELTVGFAKKFSAERVQIQNALERNLEASNEFNSDLITYVRNISIRYPDDHSERLREVGINLPKEVLKNNYNFLQTLDVPKEICVNNFYWDPITLNKLYLSFVNKEWPEIPTNIYFSTNPIKDCIIKMASFAPLYFNRYLPKLTTSESGKLKILSLSIFAEAFGKGDPLREVINPSNFPIKSGSDIEDRINDIQTKVVYGIPKLLKPLFQINDVVKSQKTAAILSFIEVGGTDPRLRLLIELGVPRETAIQMLADIPTENLLSNEGIVNEDALTDFFERARTSTILNKWHKVLIREL